jgi:hypothetical protein
MWTIIIIFSISFLVLAFIAIYLIGILVKLMLYLCMKDIMTKKSRRTIIIQQGPIF